MPGRVKRPHFVVAEHDYLTFRIERIDRRQRLAANPEYRGLFDRSFVQKQIVPVKVHGDTERSLRGGHAGYVVDMRVCQENVTDRKPSIGCRAQERLHFVARIDQHGFSRTFATDQKSVLEERTHGARLDYHGESMVLVLVDDLMFLSKVRSAAARLGVQISTPRSPAAPIEEMRQQTPELVILDLNNRRSDALATVAAMKQDPLLAAIPTVAFAGHTQLDLLAAARKSGVSEVLTKGAFTEMLPEILGRAAGTAGT